MAPQPPREPTRFDQRFAAWLGEHALDLVVGFFVLLPSLFAFGYFFPPINHDTAAILSFSRRWLEGEQLYIDLIDINTPLTFVIHAVPVLMAQVTGLSVPASLTLFFILCIAASLAASHYLLSRFVAKNEPLIGVLCILLLFYFLIIFPSENFGQREHLMMIAAFPYVLLGAARAQRAPVPLAFQIGLALCVALAIGQKPHFLPVLVVVELYVLAKVGVRRSFRDPVPWLIFVTLLLYLVWSWFFIPAFWTNILPLAAEEYSKLGEGGYLSVAFDQYQGPTLIALLPLTVAAFFISRTHLSRQLALYSIAASISNILQAKGWPYHVMPAQCGTFLLTAVLLGEAADRLLPRDERKWRMPIAGVVGAIMLLTYYPSLMLEPPFRKQREFADSPTATLLKIVKRDARNGRMLVFSPGIYPIFPLVTYARARMVMPYQTMWVLQGLYHDCEENAPLYREPEDMSDTERKLFEEMGRYLAERRPEVVIVDRIPGMPRCHEALFDYLEYFLRNPVFAEAWKSYEYVTTYDRYVVYRRL